MLKSRLLPDTLFSLYAIQGRISKNGPDMASVHKFWYFLLVTYSFSLKILIFGLNFTYEIFRKVMAWASS